MGVEHTRALLERGYPDALTVTPEELAALRLHDRLEVVRLLGAIFVLALMPFFTLVLSLGLPVLLALLAGGSWY